MHSLPCPQTRNERLNGLVFNPGSLLESGVPAQNFSIVSIPVCGSLSWPSVVAIVLLSSLSIYMRVLWPSVVATFVGESCARVRARAPMARAYVRVLYARSTLCWHDVCVDMQSREVMLNSFDC